MHVDLDNINFYNHPPPSRPAAHAVPCSGWKPYHVPSALQSLSHPLPPKPPPTHVSATIPTATIKNHFQCTATFRNIFDTELENVLTRENSPVARQIDLVADYQCRSEGENAFGARCQDTSPALVPSSMTWKLPNIPADTGDSEGDDGGGNQSVTRKGALRLDTCRQSLGDAVCSSSPIVTAEADSDYLDGRPVVAVDNPLAKPDSLQLSCCDANKQTLTIDGVPNHYSSKSPSPAFLDLASRPTEMCRAQPDQHHETTLEDLRPETASRGDRVGDLTGSVSNTPTITPSISSSRDVSTRHEDNMSVLPSPSWQPQHKEKQVRSKSSHSRVICSRGNTEPNQPDRRPSIAVVIPIRRSARLMAGASTGSLAQLSHRRHQASASYDSEEDTPTGSFTKSHSLLAREASAEGKEHPPKRRRRNLRSKDTAKNTSVSASSHAGGCIGAFQAPSVDFPTSPGEMQEIFGRGIIRIQPHGPRHVYFLTFLPDAVDRPLSGFPPGLTSDQPSHTESATYASSKACAVEQGNVQLPRRQTQAHKAKPKAQNNRGTHQRNFRKGKRWLPQEEELLVKLKRDQGLPWSGVTRLFSEQYPGRSQGSIQVYWSTNLKKRLS